MPINFMTVYGSTASTVISVNYNDADDSDIYLPVVAAGIIGRGKLLGGYHKSMFNPSDIGDTNLFIVNALRWVSSLNQPRVAIMEHDNPLLTILLSKDSITATVVRNQDIENITISLYDAVFTTDVGCTEATFLLQYVKAGGGVIIAVTPKGYVGGHFGTKFPPNLLSMNAGFVWGNTKARNFNITRIPLSIDASISHTSNTNVFDCWNIVLPEIQTNNTIYFDDPTTPLFQYGYVILEGLQHVPKTDLVFSSSAFYDTAKEVVKTKLPQPIPTTNNPIKLAKEKFYLLLFHALSVNVLEPADIVVHRGSNDFPGDCKTIRRAKENKLNFSSSNKSTRQISMLLNRTVGSYFDTKEKFSYLGDETFWYSTGFYADAGVVFEINITSDGCYNGLFVQVGSHSTILNADSDWRRLPGLISKTYFDVNTKQFASPYGGIVYIGIPPGNPVEENWSVVEATIRGNVFESLPFINKQSFPEAWLSDLQLYESCWVELEGEFAVITLSVEEAKTIARPEKVVIWWDSIMQNMITLRNISQEGYRKYRFVFDRLEDVRYYTEPYPMPINALQLNYMLNAETVKPHTGYWEFLTSIGSHQLISELVFPGMYLQLPSLFALYIFENMLFIPRNKSHTKLENFQLRYDLGQYLDKLYSFDWYTYNIWVPFYTLLQLQTMFGWVYITYLFESSNILRSEGAIYLDIKLRDYFVVVSSNMVKMNLIPLFESWKWPLSPGIDAQLNPNSMIPTTVTAKTFYNSIPDNGYPDP